MVCLQESGLSAWISSQLNALHHLESVSLVLAICLIMAAVTEVTSNAATCALFLPILGDLVSDGFPLFIPFSMDIEDLTRVVILFEIYEKSLRLHMK